MVNLTLRPVEELAEALSLGALLERGAAESGRGPREGQPRPDRARIFLERHFAAPESLLLLAEESGRPEPWGLCLTGPLEDPWSGERSPLILALWVEQRIRHRGVARALVKEAGRLLEERGVAPISARAAHNDDALISMGERWGFLRAWEYMVRD